MSSIKYIALAFFSLGKSAHSAVLSKGIKSFPAPGKKLMGIGLMSHIPDDLISRQVKRQMQRNGQLHHPQVGRQMAAVLTDLLNQELPDFPTEQLQLFFI